MRQRIVALVALSKNRFQLAVGNVESRSRVVDWMLCTEIALSAVLSDDLLVGVDQSFLDLLSEATHILVCQGQVRDLLLRQADRVLDDTLLLMDPPVKRACMLWPSCTSPVTSRHWELLLSQHWQAVDLIYTHVRRAHQTAVADEMRQKKMTISDFFQQYAYRPLNKVVQRCTTDRPTSRAHGTVNPTVDHAQSIVT
jgi:hypothetical protein